MSKIHLINNASFLLIFYICRMGLKPHAHHIGRRYATGFDALYKSRGDDRYLCLRFQPLEIKRIEVLISGNREKD